MRCGSLFVAGAVVAGLLAACGEGAESPGADETTRETREGDAEAAQRAAKSAAPARLDETAAAVERLAAEWDDPPEGRSRGDVVRELAALGAEGLERLIVFAATDPNEFRDLVRDVAEALGDDAVPVFAKVLREQTGTAVDRRVRRPARLALARERARARARAARRAGGRERRDAATGAR